MAFRNTLTFAGRSLLFFLASLMLGPAGFSYFAAAADYQEAEKLYFSGQYAECAKIARGEVERGVWNEKWPTLLLKCQLTTGQYEAAVETYETATDRFKSSIGLRFLGHQIYQCVDNLELARRQYQELVTLVRRAPWHYSSASDRITLGRFFLQQGEDPREVLELWYDRARRSNPKLPDVYAATAELALEKHDYQEAANALQQCVQLQPHDPDIYLLQAKAWKSSDSDKAAAAIARALELNPRHIPSLLFQADHLIDAEQYETARKLLTRVLEINLRQPEVWAYHAVIAHLEGHHRGEAALRDAALSSWSSNPHVDHLIGTKLSQKYRFAEGAVYQRRALRLDPKLLAAKFQLSQDLLRLGNDAEGWALADEVHSQDGYNVVAYNLMTLRDELKKFTTLETDRFHVRMEAREARVYGQRVLDLLTQAHDELSAKYGVSLEAPVTVEIFPQQKDFAIRTFGLPGGAGFLGVCFGRVITANSPASQGERPANWQSVLWHEFCHVVTLEKTGNKIPRWLSEGISVYEEQQRNPSWGERLTPAYRKLILSDDFPPVSQLSSAFLRPKSPLHLQFAYYESSLVVRYLIDTYGLETLERVLTDLSVGMTINRSLERYVGSMAQLDQDFRTYARRHAQQIAPDVEFGPAPELLKLQINATKSWLEKHPNHYQGLLHFAKLAMKADHFDKAEEALLHLRQLYPQDRDSDGVLARLALLYRRQAEPAKEKEVLTELARLNDRALEVYQRLCELERADANWHAVRDNAFRYLAVNPLLPRGHELLATAAEPLGRHEELATALTAMLEMNPVDPAGLHYRVAKAHHQGGTRPLAKRHVLMALEQAPRYRDAQGLLLQLVREGQK